MCNFDWDKFWEAYEKKVREGFLNESKGAIFFRDGIVNGIDEYNRSNVRPLFILKEVHDKGGCSNCDNKNNCEHKKNEWIDFAKSDCGFKCGKNMWKKVKNLCDIIIEGQINSEQHSNSFAVVNLKKIAGGSNVNSEESQKTLCYQKHAENFQQKLKEQIKQINANIIICGGTFEDCKNIGLFSESQLINDVDIEKGSGIRKVCKENDKTIIVDAWHPAARITYNKFKNALGSIGGDIKK